MLGYRCRVGKIRKSLAPKECKKNILLTALQLFFAGLFVFGEKMELIKIEKNNTVDAKELHKFLEVGKDFSSWIKGRVSKYFFVEDSDFVVVKTIPQNGGLAIDYYLSIDMAKELSMVERNDKGKEARQYFIECEKNFNNISISNPPLLPDFSDPVAAARAWADAKEGELKSKLALEEAQPKIEFHDQVGDSTGLLNIGETSKMLGTGRTRFFDWLRDESIFMGREPYQKYIDQGYFEVKTTESNGHIQKQSFATPKGLIWLQKRFK